MLYEKIKLKFRGPSSQRPKIPPALKPTIKNFRNSLQDAFSVFGWDSQVINLVSMNISYGRIACQLAKLINRANGYDLHG